MRQIRRRISCEFYYTKFWSVRLPVVDFAAMAYMENDDYEPVILQRTNEAVVAYAIFPELAERAFETFSNFAGIVEVCNSHVQELEDASGNGLVQFFEFAPGRRVELNP